MFAWASWYCPKPTPNNGESWNNAHDLSLRYCRTMYDFSFSSELRVAKRSVKVLRANSELTTDTVTQAPTSTRPIHKNHARRGFAHVKTMVKTTVPVAIPNQQPREPLITAAIQTKSRPAKANSRCFHRVEMRKISREGEDVVKRIA